MESKNLRNPMPGLVPGIDAKEADTIQDFMGKSVDALNRIGSHNLGRQQSDVPLDLMSMHMKRSDIR